MIEEWRGIKGYKGMYEVSNLGRVKSLSREIPSRWGTITSKERILKSQINKYGYVIVWLTKDKIRTTFLVHRLVAIAFIPNPNNYPEVNHKHEFEKANNEVSNLEWCTRKYNHNYGTRNERNHEALRKPVYQYTLDYKLVKRWDYIKQSFKLGYDNSCISKCCKGKSKTYKGYLWSYVLLNNQVQF